MRHDDEMTEGMGSGDDEDFDEYDDDDKRLSATGTSGTRTRTMSLTSSSVDSSFRSLKSKGSMSSLMNRNSSRKILVSNISRNSRRKSGNNPNNKQKEPTTTWLRDTLSLASSSHSDFRSGHSDLRSRISDEDVDLHDSFAAFSSHEPRQRNSTN